VTAQLRADDLAGRLAMERAGAERRRPIVPIEATAAALRCCCSRITAILNRALSRALAARKPRALLVKFIPPETLERFRRRPTPSRKAVDSSVDRLAAPAARSRPP